MTSESVLAILDRINPFDAGEQPAFGASDLLELTAIAGSEQALLVIAGDGAQTAARRYAAAEALLEGPAQGWRTSREATRGVADALALAMREDLSHNRWGLPGFFTGRMGDQLLSLDSGVVEALLPLLDDNSRLSIEGSEEATLDHQRGYRIADLAAYLISRHRGSSWSAAPKVKRRDKDIAALKAELAA